MEQDQVCVADHEEGTKLHLEVYGYFTKLGDGNGGEQVCLVCSNCDVSRIGELVNAAGCTTDSILGRRLLISIQDEK